ncbi:DEAD/DEAH box helicase [Cyclobacterium sp. 1_MG-2023]|uniref:DEAD/DEAH box helicase n=1 Tax=Cyclobacterium sp. 1_MG-2023 TaxID=3062681 RepID=UPI0026E37FA8|nr:DEAD/DEAH box helicase [Cyclobacterium sp. 1_MG-2023]MDO6440478.1 DEAD/DEAH box helicase [Cyclobacterium sp. 1_MG-2023]
MKKYSANYSHSNHNFVIQNLKGERISNEYLPAICILKNILQRGKPTLLSAYLQEELGQIHRADDFKHAYPLIDKEQPNWERIIRGDEKGNYYPAKKFFEELIPKHLGEYQFIQQLIIPEIPINEITQVDVDEYANQQVDFYLPQAYLIIEIDGSQHENNKQKDAIRDFHTAKYGIQTVRIKIVDLESESDVFFQKIAEIKDRIDKVKSKQETRKEKDATFISLSDYQSAYVNGIDFGDSNYKATAIIRFQLLILELLEKGLLNLATDWNFEILQRDISGFEKIVFDDLMVWFTHIFQLHKIKFEKPKIYISHVNSVSEFSKDKSIKIDFSLTKRYTDEFQINSNVIYVRTDYLDEFLFFKKGDSRDNLKFSSFEPYDYFKISATDTIKYKLKFGIKEADENSLLFLVWNIFLQNDESLDFKTLRFREGQLPIIANALSKNDTIGLLPTGSGKSVCYQLSAILQPAISFVVCPIKSLMYDQKADLDSAYFTRINHITSDDDGEDKEKIQNEFGQGKYFFIFISPERFQLKTFRHYFSAVNKEFNIAYAVIDEVHCLSEWGHDFRTSYLNLSNAIQRHTTDFNWLGLTATASINVLKNIQIEFGIKQEDVKTPVDYSRKELEFIVIDDENNKPNVINTQLEILKEEIGALTEDGRDSKCGIVFTPTVNGKNGCYPLSLKLSEHFQTNIKYYSGSVPKVEQRPIMGDKEFDEYKKSVQKEFKNNEFSLLTATKAFGMGVNKGNIHYTFHYGIPGSMESLYQEAGRAGRDKTKFKSSKAKCFVLLSKSNDDSVLSQIWDRDTTLTKVNELQGHTRGDINTNLFLFSLGLDVIKDEFEVIKKLFTTFAFSNKKDIRVKGNDIGTNKAKTEKAIYRLSQLGVIEDWTINDFFRGGSFNVDFAEFSEESIKESLLFTIKEYDKEFSFNTILIDEKYSTYKKILNAPINYSLIDKYILILLQWSYDNFAYNRRQSLKNIYENCCDFANGDITSSEFKVRLENYFKFTQKSYVLQHIAENPKDFEKWFEVFYQIDKNIVTNTFIIRRQQESLRDNLSRFLESYMHNTGLDLISGLVRLLLDDYGNSDGRDRLETSLEQIQHYESADKEFIVEQILKIGQELSNNNKSYLAESLYKFFNSQEFLLRISKSLGDSFSMSTLVEQANNRLKTINEKIYGGFRKIG